ncbi:MAG: hypothetical protein IPJ23_02845 [Ignavibacteriales bacterium]|nr:hypothetical protein [Ignavibacteriales bacterium]
MKTLQVLLLISFFSSFILSQTDDKILLSGNLSLDSRIVLNSYIYRNTPQFSFPAQNKKSPVLAGVLSLLVPGSGEIYSEEYLKAGIFLALEAAVITTAVIYDGKGDDKTIEFQTYADENWSVNRYAQWTLDHLPILNASLNAADYNVYNNDGSVNWSELNRLERAIGRGYSHSLPAYGEQQYFELIGKYPQYSGGWNDFNSEDYHDVSQKFLYYSGLRGDANDLYSVASTAVIGIYINHFLSALDAVWSTAQFNKDLAVKVRLENTQFANHAEFYPKLYLTYTF